jgi:pimeloyl-ACP methyl ester carboxylesterase
MTNMFVGIVDGTGCWNNDEYQEKMTYSFCSQLASLLKARDSYLRGPSGEGYYIERRAKEITEKARLSKASSVYLAGYSRGGSIAVIAARMLGEFGIGVKAMFLFDPVARHGSASSDFISGNVDSVYTARRIIGAKKMNKYDYKLFGDLAGHNPVRDWFGTTAQSFESSTTRRDERVFLGSHGALGGVGWKDVSEDGPCQMAVANFFNGALIGEGLTSGLKSYPPTSRF